MISRKSLARPFPKGKDYNEHIPQEAGLKGRRELIGNPYISPSHYHGWSVLKLLYQNVVQKAAAQSLPLVLCKKYS